MQRQSTADLSQGMQQASFQYSQANLVKQRNLQALLMLNQVIIHCLDLGVHESLNILQSGKAISCVDDAVDCKYSSDCTPPLRHSLLLLLSS